MEVLILLLVVATALLSQLPKRRRSRRKKRTRPSDQSVPSVSSCQHSTQQFRAGDVIQGRCWVIDGDTIIIGKERIRLFGIDAPELEHPYGQKSKWAMVRLCKGQEIRAETVGDYSYERHVAICTLPDGRDLSAELVKQGLALDWPKFSGGRYADLEPEGVRKRLWCAANRQTGGYFPATSS